MKGHTREWKPGWSHWGVREAPLSAGLCRGEGGGRRDPPQQQLQPTVPLLCAPPWSPPLLNKLPYRNFANFLTAPNRKPNQPACKHYPNPPPHLQLGTLLTQGCRRRRSFHCNNPKTNPKSSWKTLKILNAMLHLPLSYFLAKLGSLIVPLHADSWCKPYFAVLHRQFDFVLDEQNWHNDSRVHIRDNTYMPMIMLAWVVLDTYGFAQYWTMYAEEFF